MIKIELIDGDGTIVFKGKGKLLEFEESLVVKHLAMATPEIFKRALANNIELLQKEVESDKNNSDN